MRNDLDEFVYEGDIKRVKESFTLQEFIWELLSDEGVSSDQKSLLADLSKNGLDFNNLSVITGIMNLALLKLPENPLLSSFLLETLKKESDAVNREVFLYFVDAIIASSKYQLSDMAYFRENKEALREDSSGLMQIFRVSDQETKNLVLRYLNRLFVCDLLFSFILSENTMQPNSAQLMDGLGDKHGVIPTTSRAQFEVSDILANNARSNEIVLSLFREDWSELELEPLFSFLSGIKIRKDIDQGVINTKTQFDARVRMMGKKDTVASVEIKCLQWLFWLKQYEKASQEWMTPEYHIENNKEAHRKDVIRNLKETVNEAEKWENKLLKVEPLLLLIGLSEKDKKKEREEYFFDAVEAVQIHFGDAFQNTYYGRKIIEAYLSEIHPEFGDECKGWMIGPLIEWLIQKQIVSESGKRISEKILKEAKIIRNDVGGGGNIHFERYILKKLKENFWYTRFLIISENSNDILVNHNFKESESEVFWNKLSSDVSSWQKITPSLEEYVSHGCFSQTAIGRVITVNLFDKPRKYKIIIDRWEKMSRRFEEHELSSIIDPLVNYFITEKERNLFGGYVAYLENLENVERGMRVPSRKNDYRAFITRFVASLNPLEFHESNEDEDYADCFLKALDICRSITLRCRKNRILSLDRVLCDMDGTLWWKIDRRVLCMVKSMLLSRNETMNGSGYPSGLCKKDIPLEWRLYAIIRGYEMLSFESKNDPRRVSETMSQWATDGYVDGGIVRIFFEELPKKEPIAKSSDTSILLSEFRRKRYLSYVESWKGLLKMIDDLSRMYTTARNNNNTISKSLLLKEINELHVRILETAKMRKIIIITRHWETISDTPNGPPGEENEVLTEEWVKTSHKVGAIFQGLHFRTFTSPLIRARQTAAIICQEVGKCVRDILPTNEGCTIACMNCPTAILEESMTNPNKNIENGRYGSLLQKFVADNPELLREFLLRIVSSPDETMNLFIAHRDSGRHIMVWLENLFSKESIRAEKRPIENGRVYEFCLQWTQKVEGRFFFRHDTWKDTLAELNVLSQRIFGEIFFNAENKRVNLIALYDKFLDFIDDKREHDEKKCQLFMREIAKYPDVQYVYFDSRVQ